MQGRAELSKRLQIRELAALDARQSSGADIEFPRKRTDALIAATFLQQPTKFTISTLILQRNMLQMLTLRPSCANLGLE